MMRDAKQSMVQVYIDSTWHRRRSLEKSAMLRIVPLWRRSELSRRHPSRRPRNEPTLTFRYALLNPSPPQSASDISIFTMAGYVQVSAPATFSKSSGVSRNGYQLISSSTTTNSN